MTGRVTRQCCRRHARRGSSFIEVLLSLMLLAIAGTALVALLAQTGRSMESLRATEAQTRAASAEISALAVVDGTDLVARAGRRFVHGWSMTITQPMPDLFDITIAASDTGLILLRTTLYRPDTSANEAR
jgi:type II secretory pathway pseudopilin PulG